MHLDSKDDRPWPAPLAGRVASDADTAEVADAVVALWRDIDEALHPIIGRQAVAALYTRSLKAASAGYPWLAHAQPDAMGSVDPAALRGAISRQTAAEAGAACVALFDAFHELLASLVGASLTDRLLRSVWTLSAGDSPAQDTSS